MYSTVIGNGRTLQRDMVICGYTIPKGVSSANECTQVVCAERLND